MASFFNVPGVTYTPSVAGSLLAPGNYNGTVVLCKELNDHMADFAGTPKQDYPYSDFHDQLGVMCKDDKGTGTAVFRLNTLAFRRFADLSAKERKGLKIDTRIVNGQPVLGKGYAVDKSFARVIDPVKTANCMSIFNQFLNSLTTPEGTPLMKKLEGRKITSFADVIPDITGCSLNFTVENTPYEGKDHVEITKTRKVSAAVTVGNDNDEGDL